MNALMYIGALIFLLGWLGLIMIGLAYKFDNDEKIERHTKSLPRANPNINSESSTPE